jgi:Leucine-rich repeat (LRR) protein
MTINCHDENRARWPLSWWVIAILVVAFSPFVVYYGMNAIRARAVARKAIASGGYFEFAPIRPQWLDDVVRSNPDLRLLFARPNKAALLFNTGDSPREVNDILETLGAMKSMELVGLVGPVVDDSHILKLCNLPQLGGFALEGTAATGQGLTVLDSFPRLWRLELTNSANIDDVALLPISRATGLTVLWLEGTGVTDAGMPHLQSLTNLEILSLARTTVTDEGLSSLRQLKNLRELTLTQTRVTDAGIAMLREALPELEVTDD